MMMISYDNHTMKEIQTTIASHTYSHIIPSFTVRYFVRILFSFVSFYVSQHHKAYHFDQSMFRVINRPGITHSHKSTAVVVNTKFADIRLTYILNQKADGITCHVFNRHICRAFSSMQIRVQHIIRHY